MREVIVLILFGCLLAIAFFEAGYIWRDREADEMCKQVYQVELRGRDMNGRLVGVEATMRAGRPRHQVGKLLKP